MVLTPIIAALDTIHKHAFYFYAFDIIFIDIFKISICFILRSVEKQQLTGPTLVRACFSASAAFEWRFLLILSICLPIVRASRTT